MSSYKYTSPIEKGYTEFKLTKKQHNEIFKYRQIKWSDKYEYYYSENKIILHKLLNRRAVVLCTILFPVTVLIEGLGKFKEAWIDMLKLYKQKETGSFSSDYIWKETKAFDHIMNIIKTR